MELRLKVALTSNRILRRETNLAEQKKLDECNAMPNIITLSFVEWSIGSEGHERFGKEILERSFINDKVKYDISLND